MRRQVGQDPGRRAGGGFRRLNGVDGEERGDSGNGGDGDDGESAGTHPTPHAEPRITAGSAVQAWHPTALSSLATP
jgi:hypothetical protein